MTAECSFAGDREDALIAYLYDELGASERRDFDAHLAGCRVCRSELDALGGVRRNLAAWTPPPLDALRSHHGDSVSWWRQVPAWAQVAAALLFLGVSAGLANLSIHYDQSGLTVRTGWRPDQAAPAVRVEQTSAVPERTADAANAPWRADLAVFEQRLRTELMNPSAAAPARTTTATDGDVVKRVRALLDESERRQQRELALRVGELEAQRRSDLVKIDQNLGQIQSNTGVEVMRQRQMLNYLVRVSQKQ